MQSVLSIDASCDPAAAVVVGVDGNKAVVQEIHRFSLGDKFGLQNGVMPGATPTEIPNADGSPTSAITAFAQVTALSNVLASIKTPWTSCILLIPPHDYHSLNLDLPFAGSKGLDKIVGLEVQDLVPFDVEEFLLHYRALGARPDSNHDIHVGLLPRGIVGNALSVCKAAGLEPAMVSTPAAILGAVPFLSTEKTSDNCGIVFARDPFVYLCIITDGKACMDRVIDMRSLGDTKGEALLRELRLTFAVAEKRYGKPVEAIYSLGGELPFVNLGESLKVPVTSVPVPELVKAADNSTAFACFASVFAQDMRPPPILSNFRIKEFAYSPQLRELMRGLRSLLPYFLAALLLLLLTAVGIYSLRERRISQVKNAMYEQIRAAIPAMDVPRGSELDALEGENRKLEQQLSNLGSLSALSPLDSLTEITADLPLSSGITITRIKVEGNKMRVEGTAPDYTALEKIERALKKKKNVYCRIRKDTTASVPGKQNVRGFSLDILLCE